MNITFAEIDFEIKNIEKCGISDNFLYKLNSISKILHKDNPVKIIFTDFPNISNSGRNNHNTYFENSEYLIFKDINISIKTNLHSGNTIAYINSKSKYVDVLFIRVINAVICIRAVQLGGFGIHSSAVYKNSNAHVFFGHSGIGKSTIATLLCPPYKLINDDFNIIYKTNNTFKIASSPFKLGKLLPMPSAQDIKSIWALKQGNSTKKISIPRQEMLSLLMGSSYNVINSKYLTMRLIDNIANLYSVIPNGILGFENNQGSASIINSIIGEYE